MSAWRLMRDLVTSNKLTFAVIAALTLVGLFSGGIALADHLAPVTSPPGEAGHVLVVMYKDINVLDARGHTLGTRSCSDPNKSDYRVVKYGGDVVVLSNSFVTIQGEPYYLVAYPDPCEPGMDFSTNEQIAQAIQQVNAKEAISAAAVGYVAADRLSEANGATPMSGAPTQDGIVWRKCWVPTCGDIRVPATNTTLSSATGSILYAWWTGSYVDPHWWHVQTKPGATQVAVYGRDWSAIATDKPAVPAPTFAYVIRFVGYSPIAYDEHTAFTSTSVTLENDGDRSWQAPHPDTADDLRLCPGNPPGPFRNCAALDGTYGSTISGRRISAEMSGQMDWPASHSAEMCVDSHVADASTGWQDVYVTFVQPSTSCFTVQQPTAPAYSTPTPIATNQPQPAPPVVAPPAPAQPIPTATMQPPAPVPTEGSITLTQGVWYSSQVVYGQHFDAQYTVTNTSTSPFYLKQLYISVRGPNGENVDLGGDGDSTPILPGQSRNIYRYTDQFAISCATCGAGKYTIWASVQMPDGSWWTPPAAPGQVNTTQATMGPANLMVTQGIYTYSPAVWDQYFDANYTVTNSGSAPFFMRTLVIAMRGPHGEVVDLGGDNISTPILPGQSRQIFMATDHLAGNCSTCGGGTYKVFASVWMPDASYWNPPASNGAVNVVYINVTP